MAFRYVPIGPSGLLVAENEAGSVGPLNLIGEVGGAAERRQSMPIKLLVNGNQELLAESL